MAATACNHRAHLISFTSSSSMMPSGTGAQPFPIQVLYLSPKVNLTELNTLFSYCGTVENIQLRKINDQSWAALVAFVQPYAFQTALLLDGALIGGKPVRILRSQDIDIPITSPDTVDKTKKHAVCEIIPAVLAAASKGAEVLSNTRDELGERGKLSVDQIRVAIAGAGQAAENYVSTGAVWLNKVVDKTSKRMVTLGTPKTADPNSRKQK